MSRHQSDGQNITGDVSQISDTIKCHKFTIGIPSTILTPNLGSERADLIILIVESQP
jgi:hypothetical protein